MTSGLAPSSLPAVDAAGHAPGGGFGALALLALALAAGYLAACAVWPFTRCRNPRCEGGKVRSPSGRSWRRCTWCKGSGMRLRAGRRVFNAAKTQREKGQK